MKPLLALICLGTLSFGQDCKQPDPSYTIGADDIMLVSVWKQPKLTNTLPVKKGMISMPLLGEVKAEGLTLAQLAASIQEKLTKYIDDPHVAVQVMQMDGHHLRKCSIQAPGVYQRLYQQPRLMPSFRIAPDLQDSPGGIIYGG